MEASKPTTSEEQCGVIRRQVNGFTEEYEPVPDPLPEVPVVLQADWDYALSRRLRVRHEFLRRRRVLTPLDFKPILALAANNVRYTCSEVVACRDCPKELKRQDFHSHFHKFVIDINDDYLVIEYNGKYRFWLDRKTSECLRRDNFAYPGSGDPRLNAIKKGPPPLPNREVEEGAESE